MTYRSETSVARGEITKWIEPGWDGLDLGAGGDPILPTSIAVDLPHPYAQTHDAEGRSWPQHLHGDAHRLHWFTDGCLDYVYSSHLLEDFINPFSALQEWARVIRPGGRLIVAMPDEQLYRAHCDATGQPRNLNHRYVDMNRTCIEEYMRAVPMCILHSQDLPPYSFFVVGVKQ